MALEGHLLDDDARDGRIDGLVQLRLPAFLEGAKLRVAQVPQTQPLPAGAKKRRRGLPRSGNLAVLEAGSTLLREQVLLLGSDEVRAVDGEQRIALLHRLARVVDIEVLDVAAYLEGHFGDLPLVVVEAPHGPNDLLDGSPLDAAEGEPDHLALSGVEVDRCLRKARGVVAGNLPASDASED